MKMDDMAFAEVERLAVVNLRIESTSVPKNHAYKMESKPIERFVYITKGNVCFSFEAGELCAGERDMVYLPRNTAYSSKWFRESDFVVVDLSLCDTDGKEISFGNAPSILFCDKYCVYEGLLNELSDKTEEKDPFNWLERMSLCLKLLCEMARDTNKVESAVKYIRIKNAVTYLESNFQKDFPIEDLAKMCYLSPATFRRIFFECKGMSPVDYRNTLRIRKAAELLKSGKYSVSEASEKVGINDVKYFGKLFCRYIGVNPGSFRKDVSK